jgi:hypothetical protein
VADLIKRSTCSSVRIQCNFRFSLRYQKSTSRFSCAATGSTADNERDYMRDCTSAHAPDQLDAVHAEPPTQHPSSRIWSGETLTGLGSVVGTCTGIVSWSAPLRSSAAKSRPISLSLMRLITAIARSFSTYHSNHIVLRADVSRLMCCTVVYEPGCRWPAYMSYSGTSADRNFDGWGTPPIALNPEVGFRVYPPLGRRPGPPRR